MHQNCNRLLGIRNDLPWAFFVCKPVPIFLNICRIPTGVENFLMDRHVVAGKVGLIEKPCREIAGLALAGNLVNNPEDVLIRAGLVTN